MEIARKAASMFSRDNLAFKVLRAVYHGLCGVRRGIKDAPVYARWMRDAVVSIFDHRVSVFGINMGDSWSLVGSYFNYFLPENMRDIKVSSFRPDICYCFVFGKRDAIKKSHAKIKVFYSGEDTVLRFKSFADQCDGDVDLAMNFQLSFTPSGKGKRHTQYIRFPLWIVYPYRAGFFRPGITKDEIKRIVDAFNSYHPHKVKFCAMIASHDGCSSVSRQRVVKLLSSIEDVRCAGKWLHNDDTLRTDFGDDKVKYLDQFMFNICVENGNTTGYVTEKLFQSFDAGCIPIYNGGGEYLEPEVINRNAILYYTTDDEESLKKRVDELYHDENAYKAFISQPRLLPSAVDFIYETLGKVKDAYISMLEAKHLCP